MHIVISIALMLYSPAAYAGGGPIPASINLVFFLIVPVSYTRLMLPTNPMVSISVVAVALN